MFVNTSDHYTMTGGVSEQKAFGVEMNAMLFRSVIDGIYADKIRSPFREIATNARDAMVDAGKGDQPFDIQLPSTLRPVFSIRDFGKSLNHEQVMGIYSTMFASTKRATNDAVGMIGLGSKSPFAYTNSFNIACFLDGTKRLYNCFIGDGDVPQMALISETETAEPNGVEISFAVKHADVYTWRAAAPTVLFGFDPKPRILNETFEWEVPVAQFEGNGWWLYDSSTVPFSGAMARQGCVLYPLNFQAAGLEAYPLAGYTMVVDFPIGQLSVSTSREQLGYDNRTKENIRERMAQAYDDMTKMVQAEIDAHDSLVDACAWLEEVTSRDHPKRDLYIMLLNSMKWQGHQLTTRFQVSTMGANFRTAVFNPEFMDLGIVRTSVAHRTGPGVYGLSAGKMKQAKVLVEFDGCKKAPSRMRRFLSEMTERFYVFWVKAKDEATFEAMHGDFGLVGWTDLDSVEPLAAPPRGKNPKQSLRYLQPNRSWSKRRGSYNNDGRDVPDMEDGDILYVEQDGSDFRNQDGHWGNSIGDVHNRIWSAIQQGILAPGTKVYLVPSKKAELIALLDMKDVHDVIREAVIDRLAEADLTYFNGNPFSPLVGKATPLKDQPVIPADLAAWRDLVLEKTGADATPVVSSELKNLFHLYAKDELAKATDGATAKETGYDTMKAKYPLVFFVISNTSYYSTDKINLPHTLELYCK